MSAVTVDLNNIPSSIVATQCRTLIDSMRDFYSNPANQAEFEAWHTEKYGHPPRKASYIQQN